MSNERLEMEIMDTINLWSTKTKKNYPDLVGFAKEKALIQICDTLYYRVTSRQEKLTEQVKNLISSDSTPNTFNDWF